MMIDAWLAPYLYIGATNAIIVIYLGLIKSAQRDIDDRQLMQLCTYAMMCALLWPLYVIYYLFLKNK